MTGQRSGKQILCDGEPFLQILGGLVVFHAGLQVITLGATCLGIRLTMLMAWLVIAASIALGCWFVRIRRRTIAVIVDSSRSRSATTVIVVSLAVLMYLVLAVRACVTQDLSCDGNVYHLPAIHFWAKTGYISWIDNRLPAADLINGYPKASELLSAVLVTAFHADIPALANFLFLPLGALGIMLLSRMLGATKWLAIAMGAAWGLVPVNVNQSPTLYVDSNYCSSAIALVAVLLYYIAHVWYGDGRRATHLWLAIIAGAAAGIAFGIKASGLGIAGIGAVALAGFCVAGAIRRRKWSSLKQYILPFAVGVCVCVAAGGFWYIRNWVRCGSPFYPIGVSIAGHKICPGASLECVLAIEPNTPPELRGLPTFTKVALVWSQSQGWNHSHFAYDSRSGGLGYIWTLGCLPAGIVLLVSLCVRRSGPTLLVFLTLLGIVTASFLIQPMPWWARYTAWLHAFGLPVLAATLSMLPRQYPIGHATRTWFYRVFDFDRRTVLFRTGRVWTTACVLMLLTEGILCSYATVVGAPPWIPTQRQSYLLSIIYRTPKNLILFPKLHKTVFDSIFASKDAVAIGPFCARVHPNGWVFLGGLCTPTAKREIYVVGKDVTSNELEGLLDKQVHYLIWDEQEPMPPVLLNSRFHRENVSGHVVFDLLRTSAKAETMAARPDAARHIITR